MLAYTIRRIAQSIFVLFVVGLVAFSMFRFVGDPVDNMLGQERTQEDVERLREQLGLDQPFIVQYFRFLEQAAQGNFGLSYRQGRPVAEILLERAPATLELAFVSGMMALAGGIALGIFTAIRRRGFGANVVMTLSLIGVSLPTFLIGILLIYLFSVELGWLPSFGRGEVVEVGGWTTGFLTASGLKALILPSITLGLYQMTLIMRLVRTEMLEVLRMDYIRFARARGLREKSINFRHALKNTLVPVITITGLQLGSIIAFAIITETVFQWPGVGLLFINAIQFVDIPVMAAYLMLISVMFVGINLIVDMLYFAIDPRLRADRTSGGH
ncbi:ABC transporter permease [Ponticoccus sp. SC2-23]|uniref:ABC transporter permease n=1 Tax=Alexandriicola marinus TaxID=2081710 RepID=UPI000FD753E0|nr:ABC transporter permease [Alexandriicola marinus]MBM1221719.1 ABC transporter permease [Ponticoccus sp. SC6-9]MBM1226070.1 ABC transporter permease [Ponticoccus sp. SC6-15]MBM1230667.1 ABC transporter permease [Ponticoccus sp. SC6-38]MBM1235493.1 ABC transporter permease [Ponticoccus sp. SC6-45]MBM1239688.1 ABC transporter permease [Ponticoccus sp. SC6-49]MBM1243832.1 ABC transporter permease [Ponticoccus sp. SC2-64]MBM1249016.1 ABC transporter permease [Ponticoccus sp. SC6-42]MBM1253343